MSREYKNKTLVCGLGANSGLSYHPTPALTRLLGTPYTVLGTPYTVHHLARYTVLGTPCGGVLLVVVYIYLCGLFCICRGEDAQEFASATCQTQRTVHARAEARTASRHRVTPDPDRKLVRCACTSARLRSSAHCPWCSVAYFFSLGPSLPRSFFLSSRSLSLSLSLSPSFVISLCCCSNANPLRFKRACCSFQGTASVERARTCIILLLCVGTPSVVADPAVGCHGGGGVDVGLAPLATTSPVSSSPPRNINGSPAGACAELQQLGVRAHCCPVPCISACSRLTCYVAALSFYCMHCHVAVVVVLGDS